MAYGVWLIAYSIWLIARTACPSRRMRLPDWTGQYKANRVSELYASKGDVDMPTGAWLYLPHCFHQGGCMGLRTPEQYKASLKDGREVYYRGELVQDVTTHPVIGVAVEHACIDYRMAEDPR